MAEAIESSKGEGIVSKTGISATTNDGIPIKKLYVRNLPQKVTKRDLIKIFSKYGKVECAKLMKKSSVPYTFITFTDENIALKVRIAAIEQNIVCKNEVLHVSPVHSDKQPDSIIYQEKIKAMKMRNAKKQKKSQRLKVKSSRSSIMLDLLDDDSFIKIFSYLPLSNRLSIERVCKRWQAISLLCWSDIKNLKLGPRHLNEKMHFQHHLMNNRAIEKILIRCGRFLNTFDINSSRLSANSHVIPMITQHCQNLICLTLRLNDYPTETLRNLFCNTQKLSSLTLIDLDKKFSTDSLKNLPIDSMKEISLIAKDDGMFWKTFIYLRRGTAKSFQRMKKLCKFELNGFSLRPNDMKCIANNKTITHLILENCTLPKSINYITTMSGLKYLTLAQVNEVEDDFLIKLAASCPDLQYLSIGHSELPISNAGINAFAKLIRLETLKICNLYNVTDAALGDFTNLKILHCIDCSSIRDDGVIQLLINASRLEELNVCDTSVSTALLDVAHDFTFNRSNARPLRIIIDSALECEWNRPLNSSANLIIDVQNEDNLRDIYSYASDESYGIYDDSDDDYNSCAYHHHDLEWYDERLDFVDMI